MIPLLSLLGLLVMDSCLLTPTSSFFSRSFQQAVTLSNLLKRLHISSPYFWLALFYILLYGQCSLLQGRYTFCPITFFWQSWCRFFKVFFEVLPWGILFNILFYNVNYLYLFWIFLSALWGFHDRLLTLRKALCLTMTSSNSKTAFFRRWRWHQTQINKQVHFKFLLLFSLYFLMFFIIYI